MMEASTETIDGLLASLMAMGFDQDDCQDAIKMGKLRLNDAVEWILSGKPKPSTSGHLVLYGNQASYSSSIETPHAVSEVMNQSNSGGLGKQTEVAKTCSKPEDDASRAVLSRYAASREDRSKIQEKKRRKLEQEVRQDKINKMKLKENVLKEIECDREAQRRSKEPTPLQMKSASTPPAHGPTPSQASACLVQIRLPNGSAIRHKFPSCHKVRDVLDFLKDKISAGPQHQVVLLQPFPRLELLSDDPSTLAELGLCPSCSLVARLVPISQPLNGSNAGNPAPEPVSLPGAASIPPLPPSFDIQQALRRAPAGQRYSWNPPVVRPSLNHHWPTGGGHRLGYENDPHVAVQNSADVAAEEEESEEEAYPEIPQIPLEEEYNSSEEENERGDVTSGGSHVWGSGRLLGGEEAEGENNVEIAQEDHGPNHQPDQDGVQLRRNLVIQALEQRLAHNDTAAPHRTPSPSHPEQEIPTLFARSLKVLLRRIDAFGKDKLSTLGCLPLSMANRVMKELIEKKKLNPHTIMLLRACPLIKLKLDYYPYATNHLLGACKVFRGLRILSLRSCALLTDKGLTVLESLQRLQYLDISGCVKLSNKTLTHLRDCEEVTHLSLDGTRISDSGLSLYLRHCGGRLVSLSLRNLPGITEASLSHDMHALQALYIDKTKVGKVDKLFTSAPNLQVLSLSGCSLAHDQFQYFALVKDNLTSLNVMDVTSLRPLSGVPNNDIGDYVMQHLKGFVKLQKLEFNYRHSLTGTGLSCLETFPLTSLDLSHHRSVDDVALRHVALMTSLKLLDLTNTNISDDGLTSLTPLLSRLNELVLNKTPITSRGVIDMLEANHHCSLTVLSLQSTNVDNTLLRRQTINQCATRLVSLNLRNTKVSDSGLRHLVLSLLASLYLNDTKVRVRSRPEMYPGCPSLRHVHVNNSILTASFQAESDSDESDDV